MRPTLLIALFGTLVLAGCSSESDNPTPADLLPPPPAGSGVQYKMVSTIAAGQEIERCQLFVAPPSGLAVRKDEVKFTAGSHHVLLYKTPYTSLPTMNRQGVAMDGTAVHDCADGASAEWEVNGILAGSQSSGEDTIVGELPEGVAIKVEPGAVLLMNTHYLNASSAKVLADARINLYTLPPEKVKTEAGVLFFYNPFIRVFANAPGEARMRCPIPGDISVTRVQSHMHRRGVGFSADLTDDKGAPLADIYDSATWQDVPAKDFSPPLQIKAGQAIDYRCEYNNTEARNIAQGQSTKDEMCVLVGPYFPRDPDLEACLNKDHIMAATWIGSGTATCGETIGCVAAAQSADSFYGCIVNSCPGAASAMSEALRCQMTNGHGQCDAACSGMGGNCLSCLQTACAAELNVCQAAPCGG